jgi:hypothetical protein
MRQNSGASGINYQPQKDQTIPPDSEVFPWAQGLVYGHERVHDFLSANDDDPMQGHQAFAVTRMLVFDTVESAVTSFYAYVSAMGRAVTQSKVDDDYRIASLRYSVSSEKLNWFSEGFHQQGAVISWVLYQDNTRISWTETAHAIAQLYLAEVLTRYPSLAS